MNKEKLTGTMLFHKIMSAYDNNKTKKKRELDFGTEMAVVHNFPIIPKSIIDRINNIRENDGSIIWFCDDRDKQTNINNIDRIAVMLPYTDLSRTPTRIYLGFIKEWQQKKQGKIIQTTNNPNWVFCAILLETELDNSKTKITDKYCSIYLNDKILEEEIKPLLLNKEINSFNKLNLQTMLNKDELNLKKCNRNVFILSLCEKAIKEYKNKIIN